jgi:hypothetical protein
VNSSKNITPIKTFMCGAIKQQPINNNNSTIKTIKRCHNLFPKFGPNCILVGREQLSVPL